MYVRTWVYNSFYCFHLCGLDMPISFASICGIRANLLPTHRFTHSVLLRTWWMLWLMRAGRAVKGDDGCSNSPLYSQRAVAHLMDALADEGGESCEGWWWLGIFVREPLNGTVFFLILLHYNYKFFFVFGTSVERHGLPFAKRSFQIYFLEIFLNNNAEGQLSP